MLQRAVNYWKGQVTLRVESGFPERVLNVCAARQIAFWDLRWETPLSFTFTVTRRDFRRLKKAAERLSCEIAVVEKEGMPYLLRRFRRRYALTAGLALCALALLTGSFFIWDFEIEGNETLREEEILRALEKYGVGLGTFGFSIESEQLRNDILLELPKLSYIAVNVRGCRAQVQVRERVEAPEIVDKRRTGNTVAKKDGLITEIRPLDGQKLVLAGTTVQKGQLLISGVTDDEQAGTRFLRGMGKVYARTWYDLRCKVPQTVRRKHYTGEERTRVALCWGNRRLNLYLGGGTPADCDKAVERTQLRLPGDIMLPVTVVRETLRFYEETEEPRTAAEAEAAAAAALRQVLLSGMEEGEVERERIATVPIDGSYLTALEAECREQIGQFVELPRE